MSFHNSWLPAWQPKPTAQLRLFCFPYAGGGAMFYRTWPHELPPAIDVCAVQLPGRETRLREPPSTQLEPLVHALADGLRPYLDAPFAFFGHSLGAQVSFELAQTLRRQGLPLPGHLFVSACRAPQVPRREPEVHDLPDAEFIAHLVRYGGMPEEVVAHAELMALFLPILRADFTAHETYAYKPGPVLPCGISAFGGLQDHEVWRSDLVAWRVHTAGEFRLRLLPGNHFYLAQQRPAVLRAIVQDLQPLVELVLGS